MVDRVLWLWLKIWWRQAEDKIYKSEFLKFVSPPILKIKVQRRVLNKASVVIHLIAHCIWYYGTWWWKYRMKTKRDHILKTWFLKENNKVFWLYLKHWWRFIHLKIGRIHDLDFWPLTFNVFASSCHIMFHSLVNFDLVFLEKSMNNTSFLPSHRVAYRSVFRLRLSWELRNFNNGCHFGVKWTFYPEAVLESEYITEIATGKPYDLHLWLASKLKYLRNNGGSKVWPILTMVTSSISNQYFLQSWPYSNVASAHKILWSYLKSFYRYREQCANFI